jgi:hypothetical protein
MGSEAVRLYQVGFGELSSALAALPAFVLATATCFGAHASISAKPRTNADVSLSSAELQEPSGHL